MFPWCVTDEVATPTVGKLMGNHIHVLTILSRTRYMSIRSSLTVAMNDLSDSSKKLKVKRHDDSFSYRIDRLITDDFVERMTVQKFRCKQLLRPWTGSHLEKWLSEEEICRPQARFKIYTVEHGYWNTETECLSIKKQQSNNTKWPKRSLYILKNTYTGDDRWRCECKYGILHSSVREAWWKYQNIVGCPSVRIDNFLERDG